MLSHTRKLSLAQRIFFLVLIATFFGYILFFTLDFLNYEEHGYIRAQNSPRAIIQHYLPKHTPLPPKKQLAVDDIQDWMTFHYLTVVFHLPNDYLKTTFQIKDSGYASQSLRHFAKKYHLALPTFLTAVRSSITAYRAHLTPTQK